MLAAERLQRIVEWVNERGSMRVTELAEVCGVTEETIRRDLDRLENEGKLKRSHGGAISIREEERDAPFREREIRHREQKEEIARTVAGWIRPKERIILDASSTAWYVATMLPDMPLTVLTNSMMVATALDAKPQIEVICTGGTLAKGYYSFVGPLAERSLETYHVDRAFISCKGINAERGVSESSELEAIVKRKMIEIADSVVLLADASKIGRQAFAQIADLSRISQIVTDRRIAPEQRAALEAAGVQVTVCP
ncbi:DeoR/GlpR family DNA-binding transcription regulator [Paenibacillus thermoaerophilus]|uniref:DeoR/GlpR family DNA-binding transcription regulator n=1 Tax=Paenibacillus thermoaerophilus TaxID=1215385 RepID=A0ABW2V8X4_9BACL|nr:DeoR/GlpR family DNA-binding transcription regulator [Paenibacillus thermoaerophilus]TMV17948.1 DeoR/GlpR transcriptional regulator [Paenibacillus thermoaerophilus]